MLGAVSRRAAVVFHLDVNSFIWHVLVWGHAREVETVRVLESGKHGQHREAQARHGFVCPRIQPICPVPVKKAPTPTPNVRHGAEKISKRTEKASRRGAEKVSKQ